jgi:hypothetical protein
MRNLDIGGANSVAERVKALRHDGAWNGGKEERRRGGKKFRGKEDE